MLLWIKGLTVDRIVAEQIQIKQLRYKLLRCCKYGLFVSRKTCYPFELFVQLALHFLASAFAALCCILHDVDPRHFLFYNVTP
jgi:hypothetical protein